MIFLMVRFKKDAEVTRQGTSLLSNGLLTRKLPLRGPASTISPGRDCTSGAAKRQLPGKKAVRKQRRSLPCNLGIFFESHHQKDHPNRGTAEVSRCSVLPLWMRKRGCGR